MKVELLTCPSKKPKWFVEFQQETAKKISMFWQFRTREVSPKRPLSQRPDERKEQEAEAFLKHLDRQKLKVLFTEEGEVMSTEDLSKAISRAAVDGRSGVQFLIGGPFGFHERVKESCDLCLSLSALTLNHHVAEIVVLEQIFRVAAILNNHPYHNA